jgi:glucans biosynthesis protein
VKVSQPGSGNREGFVVWVGRIRVPRMAAYCVALFAVVATYGSAADQRFDFDTLRQRARALALKPHVAPPRDAPEWLQKLSYDQHRIIEFDQTRSLWRNEKLPFQVQFFHPGWFFNQSVRISEVRDGRVEAVPFRRDYFRYHQLKVGDVPPGLGFAGFKLLYPVNGPGRPGDELGAFLGASYFRLLCKGAVYGLSARGLALNTGEAGPEEFPVFTEFWLERPTSAAKELILYALLDSDRVAGAYRFAIAPGADTIVHVKAVLYTRKNAKVFGVAPLTSMFWRGENTNGRSDDFRPEVHDSDGLLIHNGAGEWIWRPLQNPGAVRTAAFADENVRGFGLLQRDRNFGDYQDLEATYHARPSAWIEPLGEWGRGSVRLVELPTRDEFSDNIVAFWAPEKLPAPGEPIELEYRLHWFMDQIGPPGGFVHATRQGRSSAQEPELHRFIVDFDGPRLRSLAGDSRLQPVLTAGDGAKIVHSSLQKIPANGMWRVTFAIKPDGSGRPVELRCFLRQESDTLTETWSYLWQP